MDLFEDDLLDEKKKVKKAGTIIIIAIGIVIILIIGVLIALSHYESIQLGMYIDGVQSPLSSSTVIKEENGKIYLSIRDLSKVLNYTYYNGEYGAASEDTKKGFVQANTEEEVVSFEMNSKKIYKILLNSNAKNNEYDYLYIEEPIKYKNGTLYTTLEGIKRIYNVDISYNESTNKIKINTLTSMVQYYITNVTNLGAGYNKIDERFYNQKSIISGMLVVANASGKYGVINISNNTEIIGTKYSNITYIEATNEFLVENNGKVGIVNNLGRTKIALNYDDLKLLDNDLGLYIARNDNRYGVINKQGAIIIHLEYEDIGVDKTLFKNSEIDNPYLLYDNCIPVCRDKQWGIYSKTGKLIVPIEYDTMGCVISTSKSSSTNNALLLKDYEGIILGKNVEIDGKNRRAYAVVNTRGEFLVSLNNRVESIYYVTENGQDIYQIEINGQKGKLVDVFERSGIKKVMKDNVDAAQDGGNIDIDQDIMYNETTDDENTATTSTTPEEVDKENSEEQNSNQTNSENEENSEEQRDEGQEHSNEENNNQEDSQEN